jgi:CRISPR-associated protein Cas2
MANIFLVAYDVVDDQRRTRVHKKLKGYGEALQYSLFRCTLSPAVRVRMKSELWQLLDLGEDRLLLVDLGPADGGAPEAIEIWGKPIDDPASSHGPRII